MLGSVTFVVLALTITLSLLGVTSLLDIPPLLSGLVVPILNSAIALFFGLAAFRGKAWSIQLTVPLAALALSHLVKFDLAHIAIFLVNIGLAALSFYLMRRCIAVHRSKHCGDSRGQSR
ncbi:MULTISPECIES: hypothetical protein [unclassified Thalassolituus]|uniref:hypothetical protein n=1 Tax=unclassified Thalassolituus TaxID=2624967 RepID=UPI000B7629AB|nr:MULTISPECIES: hypothetical protein [unclassified Thalassolituus]MBN56286.1 hypothetical protein [Oceanospirillaceae bacterium]MDQ4427716.1 hypothetical protein [Thalassolituus sp.]OUX64735.1 MAG: hypothetical protein CBE36_06930 [Oceanospirillaceae bacterium TMED276]